MGGGCAKSGLAVSGLVAGAQQVRSVNKPDGSDDHGPAGDGTHVALVPDMGIRQKLSQYAQRRLTRRLYRSVPWIGGLVALATLGRAVRRKGFFGGTADTLLDFVPFVGAAKNVAEASRGRDFIPDRSSRGATVTDIGSQR
jgi:hypothetical protein